MMLAVALLLELLLGDPQSRWHPVVLFGRWAAWCEGRLYLSRRSAGVAAWWLAVSPLALLLFVDFSSGWIGILVGGVVLWASIGWKSLIEHVRAVIAAEDSEAARRQIGRIVSRDTGAMSRDDARRAALESLAENASDAVIAPLFWFVLLGPVGAAGYRMINTLDAMWGYRNERFHAFGWWAARIDDIANWIPARITALLMLLLAKLKPEAAFYGQAKSHASPNAGWPEAALAHAANVRLGGPVMRHGLIDDRPWYGPADARETEADVCEQAVRHVQWVLGVAALLAWVVSHG